MGRTPLQSRSGGGYIISMFSDILANEDSSKTKIIILSISVVVAIAMFFSFYYYNKGTRIIPPEVIQEVVNLNDSGDFKGAQAYLEEQIKANPSSALRLMLANSILNEGSVKGTEAVSAPKAREILLAIEKSGDKSVFLYDLLGYSYEIINDFDNALAQYNKSLAFDSKSVNTLFSIGHTYWLKGDTDRAKEQYNKAEAAITEATDKSVLVKVYVAQGRMNADPKKAEVYFLKALPLVSSKAFKAELYANVSTAQYLQKNPTKAVEYANLAIEIDPSNELGYLAYARAVISDKDLLEKNLAKVEEYLIKAIFLAPTKAETQYWYGKLDFVTKRYDLAIKSYDTARLFIPKDNTLTKEGRDALMGDVLFDEAVVYFINNDQKYKIFLSEAFKYDPVKTIYVLDNDPALKKMKEFISNNIFLRAKPQT